MKALPLVILAILIGVLLVPNVASAALTSQWQVTTKDSGGNITNKFEAKSVMNVFVLPPQSLSLGGVRNVIVWSATQNKELARYSLGYYASGPNQTAIARNVTVNLGAFPSLIHGDTILIQVRNAAETIEYTTAVSVNFDIDALLKQQSETFYGLFQNLQNQFDQQVFGMQSALDTNTRFLEIMGIAMVFMVAFTTRDLWYGKKKRTEQTKSDTEFEQWLEAFIVERHSVGDNV